MTMAKPVGAEIVERIAKREGVDPVELDSLLYDVVDPDALAALTDGADDRHSEPNLHVEFSYLGYAVTVDGGGRVSIDERPAEAGPEASTSRGLGDD